MNAKEFATARLQTIIAFRTSLSAESDRGCALMAAAFLDSQLEELLRLCLVPDKDVSEELLSASKPLGTFSARIDMAYALGKIGPKARRDLHLIRKIRNDFGHDPNPIDFSLPLIANRCRELHFTHHDKKAKSRSRFTNAVHGVLACIHSSTFKTVTPPLGVDLVVPESSKPLTDEASVQQARDLINGFLGKKAV